MAQTYKLSTNVFDGTITVDAVDTSGTLTVEKLREMEASMKANVWEPTNQADLLRDICKDFAEKNKKAPIVFCHNDYEHEYSVHISHRNPEYVDKFDSLLNHKIDTFRIQRVNEESIGFTLVLKYHQYSWMDMMKDSPFPVMEGQWSCYSSKNDWMTA